MTERPEEVESADRSVGDSVHIECSAGDFQWVLREARSLARHWSSDTTPSEFAEFVAGVLLSHLHNDLHSRRTLYRWEQRIRRDERRRLSRAPASTTDRRSS